MVLVSLVDPGSILDHTDSIFWDVKCCDNSDNIFVNSYLDLKVSFIIDPMEIS